MLVRLCSKIRRSSNITAACNNHRYEARPQQKSCRPGWPIADVIARSATLLARSGPIPQGRMTIDRIVRLLSDVGMSPMWLAWELQSICHRTRSLSKTCWARCLWLASQSDANEFHHSGLQYSFAEAYSSQVFMKALATHGDETTVQGLKEKDRKATAESYMWVYRSSQDCEQLSCCSRVSPAAARSTRRPSSPFDERRLSGGAPWFATFLSRLERLDKASSGMDHASIRIQPSSFASPP